MDDKRRKQVLVAALGLTLAVAAYVEWPRTDESSRAASTPRTGVARSAGPAAVVTAPDVRLEELAATRRSPGTAERNLFRFKPKFVPAPVRATEPLPPPPPSGPPPPPPVPPIALKFIGVLEAAGAAKIAILSDGRGAPIYGKEGDAVLGQYKILHIGAESIEMDYLDGRGRQTIRLSGS